ncbi:MAG: hypothetical protein ABJP70_07035 [Erythrobacter sp.]
MNAGPLWRQPFKVSTMSGCDAARRLFLLAQGGKARLLGYASRLSAAANPVFHLSPKGPSLIEADVFGMIFDCEDLFLGQRDIKSKPIAFKIAAQNLNIFLEPCTFQDGVFIYRQWGIERDLCACLRDI